MSTTTETVVNPATAQEELPIIAEGKTKIVLALPNHPQLGPLVLIENTDAVTALDGLRKRIIPGKGRVSCGITTRIFEYLRDKGVINHLVAPMSGNSLGERYFQRVHGMVTHAGLPDLHFHTHFFARRLEMQPFEFVVRRIVPARASYLKRNPRTPVGHRFDVPVVEVFFKNDRDHDPLVILDSANSRLLFYKSGEPMGQNYLGLQLINGKDRARAVKIFAEGQEIALRTFLILEEMFAQVNHTLVDFKIEVGFDVFSNIILGDVITPDEIRLWPDGDPKKARDKQKFRDTPDDELTPAILASLLADYTAVLELMKAIRCEPDII